jgi:hypothetical protein
VTHGPPTSIRIYRSDMYTLDITAITAILFSSHLKFVSVFRLYAQYIHLCVQYRGGLCFTPDTDSKSRYRSSGIMLFSNMICVIQKTSSQSIKVRHNNHNCIFKLLITKHLANLNNNQIFYFNSKAAITPHNDYVYL